MRLRIDELATEAGTTSRNVRAYQARGLLPAPELVGRTGFYNEEHLHRLRLIDELQQRGFSLEAIRQTLDIWSTGGDLGQLLGFQHLLTAPLTDEQPATFTLEEIGERFPELVERPDLMQRALELGLMEVDEHGDLVAPSPMIVEAGSELIRLGISMEVVFDLVAAIREDVGDIARRFLELVSDHLLTPVVEQRDDALSTAELVASLQRLRPIAIEVVRPFLAQALAAEIDRTVRAHGDQLDPDGSAASA
ncbi:MerR family transcriptional regulator [Nitriliruptor alkaliphilus]|uniref:MerR family transcriptional regulator n=1 Tax=Nitriliruptor alkaliphilus TaxID=427918 RepID=UPI0006963E7F|nr:MerR family transcriptional regulator [Nitriliruptor alkaliphilus]